MNPKTAVVVGICLYVWVYANSAAAQVGNTNEA